MSRKGKLTAEEKIAIVQALLSGICKRDGIVRQYFELIKQGQTQNFVIVS